MTKFYSNETITLWDKIVAITSYYTFGLTGIIWLIASILIFKKTLNKFSLYHIYQSIFISILLAVISIGLGYLFQLTVNIPFIGEGLYFFRHRVFEEPVFYTFTLFNFVVFIIITYLSIGALFGKKTYFPFISDVIKGNVGG